MKKTSKLMMLKAIGVVLLIIASNLYLQWCQNNLDYTIAFKFAFSWHTEKFFLACLVLLLVYGVLASLSGSLLFSGILYSIFIGILGFATRMKMVYRQEPIYPDDLKMITQFGLLREMVGTPTFVFLLLAALLAIGGFVWRIYSSRKWNKVIQITRVVVLVVSLSGLYYVSHFNDSSNLLRKAYNRTALWIPYSQKMNYYNTGFVGGFLYNLRVVPMEQPAGYSKEQVRKIVDKYQEIAAQKNQIAASETPNILFVMSESFSDPSHLKGLTVTGEPLEKYYQLANQTYSGKMLSQNYGGGTANIEFEALTSFSMELFNPQLTTPYTMLVPKMAQIPSIVSLLKDRDFQTTAIHPYDTSMYKRKDVYQVMGFDQFLDKDTMKHTKTIQNNPYISDAAAYQEVMDQLTAQSGPQFIHLVTMQTHMPYGEKYSEIPYGVSGNGNLPAIKNYLQDVAFASEALQDFTKQLSKLSRRTILVFWGDHLPGIYSDRIQNENSGATLHETQFMIYDSENKLTKKDQHEVITSPFYFAPNLMAQSGQKTTGFYQLLLELEKVTPAFEKNLYYQNGEWNKELRLNRQQEQIYQEYQMIQYDALAGKQYSVTENFFKE